MSWIDIAIIAIVVLFGLLGVWRGVKKSALSLGAFLVAFMLAFLLANIVAEGLLGIDGIKSFVVGKSYDYANAQEWSLAKWIHDGVMDTDFAALKDSFIVKNFYEPVMEIVTPSVDTLNAAEVAITAEQGMAVYLAFLLFSALVGVGIFIIARLLLIIVTVIVGSYIGKKKSALGRLFGFLVAAAHGAVIAIAITLVFSNMGGLIYASGINKIESEYEHNNAVLCDKFNDMAYSIRNKMFLPSSDMYGRVLGLVTKKEYVEPEVDELPEERLKLYINLMNLNYNNQPWSMTEDKKRHFDQELANAPGAAISFNAYREVGFEDIVEVILNYNRAAAEKVDNRQMFTDTGDVEADEFFRTINDLVQTSSVASIYAATNSFITALNNYLVAYRDGLTLTTEAQINAQNIVITSAYNDVTSALNTLITRYAAVSTYFGQLTDVTDMIPAKKTAGVPEVEMDPLPRYMLEVFIDLKNLGFINDPWTIDENDVRAFDSVSAQPVVAADYEAVGFNTIVAAILEYNNVAIGMLEADGGITGMDRDGYNALHTSIAGGTDNIKTAIDAFYTALTGYANAYAAGEGLTDPDEIDACNVTLVEKYTQTCTALSAVVTGYEAIAEVFGELPEPTVPEQLVVTVPAPPAPQLPQGLTGDRLDAYVAIVNLNYTAPLWVDGESEGEYELSATAAALSADTYDAVGFADVVSALIAHNTAAAAAIAGEGLDEADFAELLTAITDATDGIAAAWNALFTALDTYSGHYAAGLLLTEQSEVDECNAQLEADYAQVTAALTALTQKYAAAEDALGTLTCPAAPAVKVVEDVE